MSTIKRSVIPAQSASDVAAEQTVRRGLVVMCLVGVALIHVLDLKGKIENAPLVGASYIPLIIASLVLAEVMIRYDNPVAWAASGALAAATLIGFALSRTVGLPSEGGHEIGKWTGDLGLSSILIEALLVWLVVVRLTRTSA